MYKENKATSSLYYVLLNDNRLSELLFVLISGRVLHVIKQKTLINF